MQSPNKELEFEFSLKPDPDNELGHYVIDFTGKALLWDDEISDERVVAEIHGYRLDLATANQDGIDQNLLLESVTPEIADFSHVVFQGSGCHIPDPDRPEPDQQRECDGLVFVQVLEVDSHLRGHNIGTDLLRRVPEIIDVENCLIGLKAYPISEDQKSVTDPQKIERVKHFYEKMGFIRVGGEFMVKDASLCESVQKKLEWRRKHGLLPSGKPDRSLSTSLH